MTAFYQEQKHCPSPKHLFAIPCFILLCFFPRESKLEPLTSVEQVKGRGRKKEREKNSFISCTSGLELHLELITPPPSSEPFLMAKQPCLPVGRHGAWSHGGNTCQGQRARCTLLPVSKEVWCLDQSWSRMAEAMLKTCPG